MSRHPLWKDQPPRPAAWRPTGHQSRADYIAEQDAAAGGRANRELELPNGRRALVSVALRAFPSGRRIYAYLRWSVDGKTRERYIGEVDRDTRRENLELAWRQARESGQLDPASGERDANGSAER